MQRAVLSNIFLLCTAMFLSAVALVAFFFASGLVALSGDDFDPGNIIDDGVFYYPETMTAAEIQIFLDDMVDNSGNKPDGIAGSCDTFGAKPSEFGGGTRAQFAASNPNDITHDPPYICINQYSENVETHENNLRGRPVPPGAKSAAQIIYDVAIDQKINPRVLLVLLQKEQILITDDWPVEIQYRSAAGYGCPDSAPCNDLYYGFYNQVYNAARQFNLYRLYPNSYSHRAGISNNILYSPAACGSSSVFIENQATAGLYNYTPYQPNQAALNNLYGAGDACSAYGNRNFWRLFSDWFGSTQTNTPYAWLLDESTAFTDAARTSPYSRTIINAQPNELIYITLEARNMGNQSWSNADTRLGTASPLNRNSGFHEASWVSQNRPTSLEEATVDPGGVGTFNFILSAPATTGTYKEKFNLVIDGVSWFNDQDYEIEINVTDSVAKVSSDFMLDSGDHIAAGSYLISESRSTTLAFQDRGNLVLRSGFDTVWSSTTANSDSVKLTMQTDGNLVLSDASGVPIWHTGTYGNIGAKLHIQTDGNMVVYSSLNAPLWSSATWENPSHLEQVSTRVGTTRVYPGQSLRTAARNHRLTLQEDGNLVLYRSNTPLWASSSSLNKDVAFMAIQTDGNLVIYDTSGSAVWSSGTSSGSNSYLQLQTDGNLVLYNKNHEAIWHTSTYGNP